MVQCDMCGEYEDECGYGSSIRIARLIAREHDWQQRKINGVLKDICDVCIEKEQAQS
jgi:ribosomal protein L37E